MRRPPRNPGPLLLCSDLMDPEWQAGLQALLSRRFEITVLHVLAPQEVDPQLEGDVRLVDAEGGAPVDLTADLDLINRYRRNLEQWRGEIGEYCGARGIDYIPIETSLPIEDLLMNLMRRRGIVR